MGWGRRVLCILWGSILLALLVSARPSLAEPKPIASSTPLEQSFVPDLAETRIFGRVEYSLSQGVEDEEILQTVQRFPQTVPLSAGQTFRLSAIQEAIRLIYLHDHFSQVRVFADEHENRVDLSIHLTPKTRLDRALFEGNQHLSNSSLRQAMRLKENDEYFPDDLSGEAKRLLAAYRREGFIQATVSIQEEPGSRPYWNRVHFTIDEGPAVRIQSITFEGEHFYPERSLRHELDVHVGDRMSLPRIQKALMRLRDRYVNDRFDEVKVTLMDAAEEGWRESPLFQKGVVRIAIEAGRKIRFVFVGNRTFRSEELETALQAPAGRYVRYGHSTLKKLKKTLFDFYQRRGYPFARIHAFSREAASWEKEIVFQVQEGQSVKLNRILFRNNRTLPASKLEEALRAAIRDETYKLSDDELGQPDTAQWDARQAFFDEPGSTEPTTEPKPFSHPPKPDVDDVLLPDLLENGKETLTTRYRQDGYLRATVEAPRYRFNDTRQRVDVIYHVVEGPQSLVSTVRVAGAHVFTEEKVVRLVDLEAGDPLNPYSFEDKRQALQKAYAEKGYLFAQVDISYTLRKRDRAADVLLAIREGPQVRYDEVIINGLGRTRASVVRQELTFEEGDIYDPDDLEESRRYLQRLGIFQAVTLRIWQPRVVEEQKKIVVTVVERMPGRFAIGGGLATDDGLRGRLVFTYRNLFGTALEFHGLVQLNHRLTPLLELLGDDEMAKVYNRLPFYKSLERKVSAGLRHPSLWGSHIGGRVDVVHEREQERTYGMDKNSVLFTFDTEPVYLLTFALLNEFSLKDVESTFVDTSNSYKIIPFMNTFPNPPFRLRTQDDTLRETLQSLPVFKPNGEFIAPLSNLNRSVNPGHTVEYSPKFRFSYDHRDSLFNPTLGVRLNLLTEYFEILYGDLDVDLLKTHAGIAGYVPLSTARRPPVLRMIARGGIISFSNGNSTPIDKRFRLGGRTSVRGFRESSIYPSDITTEQIKRLVSNDLSSFGGNAFLLFKADLRIPVFRQFYLGGFVDSGNLWLDPLNMDVNLLQYKNAAGTGIHYRTPVGDLSLEVGWNLHPQQERDEDEWQLHFNIELF